METMKLTENIKPIDVAEEKLSWLAFDMGALDDRDKAFVNWYAQALKDVAKYSWLDENEYWLTDIEY